MNAPLLLNLTGDVMTGRGVDQILPHPADPALHEDYVRDARTYVQLAEERHGPISRPVDFSYPWGDALAALREADLRIVNLETSVTARGSPWPGKGIHYRMGPGNIGCLSAARLECCVLANNHVFDWGYDGLAETLRTLDAAGIAAPGAGEDAASAASHATFEPARGGRVLVTALGFPSSGIPGDWAAGDKRPGVRFEQEPTPEAAARIARELLRLTRPGDVTVVSVHWGGNWGYEVPREHVAFARRLADEGIDIVHGHSSHHPQAIEFRHGRLILYGCGDFLNDYEGISGRERYRGDLVLLYEGVVSREPQRQVGLSLRPFQLRRLQLRRPEPPDVEWLREVLDREGRRFGTEVTWAADGRLEARARSG